MAISITMIEFYLIRTLTIISIITLILISVYQLNTTLEFLKKSFDHIEEADTMFEKHANKNFTLAKKMFEPFQINARRIYEKNEPAMLTSIAILTTIITFSMAGLIAAIKKNASMLVLYGILLDLIYTTTFLYYARIPSLHCTFIIFVSILVFIRSFHLWSKQSKMKINLLKANSTTNDHVISNCSSEHNQDICKNIV